MDTTKRNRIKCKHCDDIIESFSVYDFKYCKCGKVFVDGGRKYLRHGYPDGKPEDHYEELP